MKCPNCKVGNLVHYKEEQFAVTSTLNKDGTISKRNSSRMNISTSLPDYIECENTKCKSMFSYELNEKGKVVHLEPYL